MTEQNKAKNASEFIESLRGGVKRTHTLKELLDAGFEVVETKPLVYLREEKDRVTVYQEVPKTNWFALQWDGHKRYASNKVKYWRGKLE